MDEITKKKISYRLRGRKLSATHRDRIAQSMRKITHSEEHNKAIAEAMRAIWKRRKEANNEGEEIRA